MKYNVNWYLEFHKRRKHIAERTGNVKRILRRLALASKDSFGGKNGNLSSEMRDSRR